MTKTKLNLGCGSRPKEGWINVDSYQHSGVFRVVDLNEIPMPWKDVAVDEIFTAHVLEHLRDPVAVLCEFHRMLKPGGRVTVIVPHAVGYMAHFPNHLTLFSRIWFWAAPDFEESPFNNDMWADQVVEMSLLHYSMSAPWPLKVFQKTWEVLFNQSFRTQIAWEMLGLFPPNEITWTATKK